MDTISYFGSNSSLVNISFSWTASRPRRSYLSQGFVCIFFAFLQERALQIPRLVGIMSAQSRVNSQVKALNTKKIVKLLNVNKKYNSSLAYPQNFFDLVESVVV